MLLITSFLLPHLFCNVEFEFNWFNNAEQSSEILILKIEMLLEFKKKQWNYWVQINAFGLALVSSDIDLGNVDFLDTHLVCEIQISPVKLLFLYKTYWRRLQDMSSKRLQDTSSKCLQDMSSRRLQRNNFSSFKTSSRRLARRLWKTSSRRLGRRKIVMLKRCWRRLQDMFSRRLQEQQMFAGFYGKTWVGFSLNIRKRFFLEFSS